MEVPVEGEFEVMVDFSTWSTEHKIHLLRAIMEESEYEVIGRLNTTVEVEPPERDD